MKRVTTYHCRKLMIMNIYFRAFLGKLGRTFILFCTLFFLTKDRLHAQTLQKGDIAFIGYDFGIIDGFSFIALKPLPAGETIYFSEQGWTATGWADNTETHLKWVIPATVPCGTIVTVMETAADVFTVTGSSGFSIALNANFNLLGGDQILAYQSSEGVRPTSPIFIAGIHGDYNSTNYDPVTTWNASNINGTAESIVPAGLTNGVDCISLFPAPGPELAYSKYNGTLTGTASALRASINNPANWTKTGTATLGILPSNFPVPNVNCTVVVTPTLSTSEATNIGVGKATLGGNVTADGGATVTERGIVWALTANPTTSNNKVTIGTGTGAFSSVVSSLPSATTIHFRAYAINSSGTAYGSDLTFTTNAALAATTSQNNVSCNGGSNGTATVTASGGVAPYTYSWAPSGGTNATASGLMAGAYTCTITDNEGTIITRFVTLTQPSVLTATSSKTNVSCNGGSNGTATVVPTGGLAPYTYSWAPSGGNNATASGLTAGAYTCTITDANNCQINKNFTITQPPVLQLSVYSGSAITTIGSVISYPFQTTGGTPSYYYTKSGNLPTGLTLSSNGVLAGSVTMAGDYTFDVIVTDANTCSSQTTVTIKVEASLPVELTNYSVKTITTGVEVTWSTISENNSSHFELRHGTDKENFRTIARIEALGNSNTGKRYSFLHREAISGKNYYQLVQVDKNGEIHDYGVKEITFGTNAKASVSIFPNPIRHSLTVSFPANTYSKIQVIDAVGKVISTNRITNKDQQFKIDVSRFSVGVYSILLSSDTHKTSRRFIKQ